MRTVSQSQSSMFFFTENTYCRTWWLSFSAHDKDTWKLETHVVGLSLEYKEQRHGHRSMVVLTCQTCSRFDSTRLAIPKKIAPATPRFVVVVVVCFSKKNMSIDGSLY